MLCRKQKGSVAIEFAIVLPLLILLVFGMVEFGLLFYNKQVITNASREGARAGITGEYSDNDIQLIVQSYCSGKLINLNGTDDLQLDDIAVAPNGSNDLSVTVNYNYNMLMAGIIGIDHVTVSARTIMRMEP